MASPDDDGDRRREREGVAEDDRCVESVGANADGDAVAAIVADGTATQDEEPAVETKPAAQVEHDVDPDVEEKVPAGHNVHAEEESVASRNVPDAHTCG